jgi:carbon-monoxide dehydrogenase iron sulfur subunit
MRGIAVRQELCSGCRACQVACVARHDGRFGIATARIRIIKSEPLGEDHPHVCRLCGRPPCAGACPSGALYQDGSTSVVLLRSDDCDGCLACVEACSVGSILV